jgi:hypothetical protein
MLTAVLRRLRSFRRFVRPPLPHHHWLGSVDRHETGHPDDRSCRTEHENGIRPNPSLSRVAWSVVSGHLLELLGSSPISGPLPRLPLGSTRAPSLPRNYPDSSVLRAPPPSYQARSDPHESPVGRGHDHWIGLPVFQRDLSQHAVANTPVGSERVMVARSLPNVRLRHSKLARLPH